MHFFDDLDQEFAFHRNITLVLIGLSPVVALVLLVFRPSTYGKHLGVTRRSRTSHSTSDATSKNVDVERKHWLGPLFPSRWSWVFFESPCCIGVILCVWDYRCSTKVANDQRVESLPWTNIILLGWFFLHYVYRSIFYPLVLMKVKNDRGIPLGIIVAAWSFCTVNGYLQARELTKFRNVPMDSQFWIGILFVLIGFYTVVTSDLTLLKLKERNETITGNGNGNQRNKRSSYSIPYGGMFRYVSSPHYFGEMVEWAGFCMASGYSLASTSFVIWTASNLVPRAIQTHKWYIDTFSGEDQKKDDDLVDGNANRDYSQLGRMAIIPFFL